MDRWDTVAIIGVGLIGGSIGKALQERGLARHVVGVGRNVERLSIVRELGIVHSTTTDIRQGVAGADLVVVCTPVAAVPRWVCAAARCCRPGTLITDVGSTKVEILRRVAEGMDARAVFVGSHPLAGSEQSGPQFARSDLFVDRLVILTPGPQSRRPAVQAIRTFWESLGAHCRRMTASQHDALLAATSHLPHLVAAALAASTPQQALSLVASGWLDSTRVASGDPELWRQILLANSSQILPALTAFAGTLDAFRQALVEQDGATLRKLLTRGKRHRDAVAN